MTRTPVALGTVCAAVLALASMRMFKKIVALLFTGALVAGAAAPAEAATGRSGERAPTLRDVGATVDGIVPGLLAKDRIPGAAVVVVAGGRQVFARGYGVADVGARRPVDPEHTGFFMGSMAKLFTATAALQLVDQGRLDLHTDVNRYLTDFKIRDTYPGRPVTLENLLTHTAGFDDDIVGAARANPADVEPLGKSLAKRQPARVRPPGTVVAYDNYGAALAGYLVEVASGEPFARYVDEHVLESLGMSATTFAQPHPAAIDATLARGYRPAPGTPPRRASTDRGRRPARGRSRPPPT
ncbi:hypothetical protein GCM10029978_006080 [Actinoallomurus acanthiterrae]